MRTLNARAPQHAERCNWRIEWSPDSGLNSARSYALFAAYIVSFYAWVWARLVDLYLAFVVGFPLRSVQLDSGSRDQWLPFLLVRS